MQHPQRPAWDNQGQVFDHRRPIPYAYTFNLTKVMAPHLACKVCSSSVPIIVIIVLLVTYPLVEARKHLKNKIMRFPHQLMGLDSLRGVHCSSCSSKDGTEFVRFQTSQKATASAAVTLEEVLLHNRYIERVCVCAYVYYKAK